MATRAGARTRDAGCRTAAGEGSVIMCVVSVRLEDYIRSTPDFPQPGILFRDFSPLLMNAAALADAIDRFGDLAKTLQPDFIVAPSLKAGRLVPILQDWSLSAIALHLVTPPGKLRPRRVTALIDFLTERMRLLPDYA